MRFLGFAVVSSVIVLGACGGGGDAAADSAATPATTDTAASVAPTPPPAGAPAAITGTTHEVKMVGDDKGYRFEPADITVKAGDGIKFIMVSGGPHNVAFDPATIPADVKPQLSANMPNQAGELSSPMFMNANEEYVISFANIKPGQYPYHCTPHLAMNMKGTITVQ
jgi:plastocyanin